MLFWSTIGLGLFYLAYRYNILFVSDSPVDSRGLIYPRALKQLFVGVYLAEICMVGMFAVSASPGPAVLMGFFLVFTVLFHITISKALDPLLYGLPRTLNTEEEAYQAQNGTGVAAAEGGALNGARRKFNLLNADGKPRILSKMTPGGEAAVQKKGNFFMRWLKPWAYADYATLRALVPQGEHMDLAYQYAEDVEADAYWPPSVTKPVPILWIPEDPAGVSKQEIMLTGKVIPITDEGCTLNEKNKIIWDTEGARPPIWNEKVYY
jgi:calcium permeable stress-gated cation channel